MRVVPDEAMIISRSQQIARVTGSLGRWSLVRTYLLSQPGRDRITTSYQDIPAELWKPPTLLHLYTVLKYR